MSIVNIGRTGKMGEIAVAGILGKKKDWIIDERAFHDR